MKKANEQRQQPYHFIAIDGFGWACNDNMNKAIANRVADSGVVYNINTYFIPLPDKGSVYDIDRYVPQVEDAMLIMSIKVDEHNRDEMNKAIAMLETKEDVL